MPFSSLSDLAEVRAAMAEFDRLGREGFLPKCGFGPAREYFLEQGGVLYDSKAVAGAAHGVQSPTKARYVRLTSAAARQRSPASFERWASR